MTLPVVPKAIGLFKSPYLPKGQSIEYTPFTIGQEHILLAVKDDTKKTEDKLLAIKQIVQECVKAKDYPVGQIPTFLLELLFLRIYQKSVGEFVDLNFTCMHETEGVPCKTALPVKLDLRAADIKAFPDHDTKVMLTDNIGVKFKYPCIDMALEQSGQGNDVDMLIACIDFIFEDENIHYAKDVDFEALLVWYKDLGISEKRKMMVTFIGSMPTIYLEKTEVCPKCGTSHKIQFTELNDFFT